VTRRVGLGIAASASLNLRGIVCQAARPLAFDQAG
jgi:hypothetical protein